MKFKFRLEILLKQKKIEQDLAQRDYAEAEINLRNHMNFIKQLYTDLDAAYEESARLQSKGGACMDSVGQINDYIVGQKARIEIARQKARELMTIEEEKHEVLVGKMREYKTIEKLKEKQRADFKQEQKKLLNKEMDDLVTIRSQLKRVI